MAINYAKPSETFEVSSQKIFLVYSPGRLLDLPRQVNLLAIAALIGFPCLRGGTTVGADGIVKNISLTQPEWTEVHLSFDLYWFIFTSH